VNGKDIETNLPGGLETEKDYWWIDRSDTTGQFARSEADALAGLGINHFDDVGEEGPNKTNHGMGLSRIETNIKNVFFEIDQYFERWPDIDGIFFDEMNNVLGDANLKYYQDILKHVRTKGGHALVVQNPGTNFPEEMDDKVADTFMTFENVAFTKNQRGPGPEIRHLHPQPVDDGQAATEVLACNLRLPRR
jgi:hypothetical protein